MIYMTKVRQELDSVFGLFDCPDGNQVMPKRSRSTTPLQALNLFNSTFVLQQAVRLDPIRALVGTARVCVDINVHLTDSCGWS